MKTSQIFYACMLSMFVSGFSLQACGEFTGDQSSPVLVKEESLQSQLRTAIVDKNFKEAKEILRKISDRKIDIESNMIFLIALSIYAPIFKCCQNTDDINDEGIITYEEGVSNSFSSIPDFSNYDYGGCLTFFKENKGKKVLIPCLSKVFSSYEELEGYINKCKEMYVLQDIIEQLINYRSFLGDTDDQKIECVRLALVSKDYSLVGKIVDKVSYSGKLKIPGYTLDEEIREVVKKDAVKAFEKAFESEPQEKYDSVKLKNSVVIVEKQPKKRVREEVFFVSVVKKKAFFQRWFTLRNIVIGSAIAIGVGLAAWQLSKTDSAKGMWSSLTSQFFAPKTIAAPAIVIEKVTKIVPEIVEESASEVVQKTTEKIVPVVAPVVKEVAQNWSSRILKICYDTGNLFTW